MTPAETQAQFTEATEKFFHVAMVLTSGLPTITPENQRALAHDMAVGLGLLGLAVRQQLDRIEQKLSHLEASARRG